MEENLGAAGWSSSFSLVSLSKVKGVIFAERQSTKKDSREGIIDVL
jgi:hypothetical protein